MVFLVIQNRISILTFGFAVDRTIGCIRFITARKHQNDTLTTSVTTFICRYRSNINVKMSLVVLDDRLSVLRIVVTIDTPQQTKTFAGRMNDNLLPDP